MRAPGTIVEARGDALAVAAGDGAIAAHPRHPARRTAGDDGREFLSGRTLSPGCRFGSRMIAPARLAAYDVLRAVDQRPRRSAGRARARARRDLPTSAIARSPARSPPARCAGRAPSTVIAAFARRPVAKLDPEVLDILRMTAFQLLHLDRVPASAAVNDAVELAGKAGKTERGRPRQRRAAADQPRTRAPAAAAASKGR